ncbi:hypothetical protein K7432_009325 [Basidiobolus ranarum]|uniref:Uncharacterized protein n=1 Tax=Basidiobolus ranarum TaxID=34480 RepID=A0ABR2VX98_9FUNG
MSTSLKITKFTNILVYEEYKQALDIVMDNKELVETALYMLALHDTMKERNIQYFLDCEDNIHFVNQGQDFVLDSNFVSTSTCKHAKPEGMTANKTKSNAHTSGMRKDTLTIYNKLSSSIDIQPASQTEEMNILLRLSLQAYDTNESPLNRAVGSLVSMTALETLQNYTIITSNLQNFLFYVSYCELWQSCSHDTITLAACDKLICSNIRSAASKKGLEISIDGIYK